MPTPAHACSPNPPSHCTPSRGGIVYGLWSAVGTRAYQMEAPQCCLHCHASCSGCCKHGTGLYTPQGKLSQADGTSKPPPPSHHLGSTHSAGNKRAVTACSAGNKRGAATTPLCPKQPPHPRLPHGSTSHTRQHRPPRAYCSRTISCWLGAAAAASCSSPWRPPKVDSPL